MSDIPLHNVIQLMSIFIIVIDTILNSERLLVVLSLWLQSLSNDSYCLNILWFILARFIRKCLMQNLFMGCKARMYLHRLLAAFWSQTEIFFASYELLGLENKGKFWIKLGTQTDFITTKQFGPYLLFIFDHHFFMDRLSDFPNCAKVSTVFLFQMTMMSVTHLWVVLCFWDSLLQPF